MTDVPQFACNPLSSGSHLRVPVGRHFLSPVQSATVNDIVSQKELAKKDIAGKRQ
ncbi:hypothetical protein [Fimbriiglobus ruber]|uniref:Uncharacterized protein n=1 Tax=Fimbriiglobus ruber TaxID=1908690 RepID=A0A225D826_9BACT|nr:hypothetical protein [Fimbriiglobus ruber]OWK37750.1 hypothetical protein FRUB_06870 [Fimbriiglobus ruber]